VRKRNLAFYKESGKDWTREEYFNILEYVGDDYSGTKEDVSEAKNKKFIFDKGEGKNAYHYWYLQEKEENLKNCKQISYESVFNKQKFKYYIKGE